MYFTGSATLNHIVLFTCGKTLTRELCVCACVCVCVRVRKNNVKQQFTEQPCELNSTLIIKGRGRGGDLSVSMHLMTRSRAAVKHRGHAHHVLAQKVQGVICPASPAPRDPTELRCDTQKIGQSHEQVSAPTAHNSHHPWKLDTLNHHVEPPYNIQMLCESIINAAVHTRTYTQTHTNTHRHTHRQLNTFFGLFLRIFTHFKLWRKNCLPVLWLQSISPHRI